MRETAADEGARVGGLLLDVRVLLALDKIGCGSSGSVKGCVIRPVIGPTAATSGADITLVISSSSSPSSSPSTFRDLSSRLLVILKSFPYPARNMAFIIPLEALFCLLINGDVRRLGKGVLRAV